MKISIPLVIEEDLPVGIVSQTMTVMLAGHQDTLITPVEVTEANAVIVDTDLTLIPETIKVAMKVKQGLYHPLAGEGIEGDIIVRRMTQ